MSDTAISMATHFLLGAVCIGCSAESVAVPPPAEWLVPIDETTPRHAYWPVSEEDRAGQRIELVEELAIRERPGDDNYTMFQILDVQADAEGNIFVADTGNQRIQVFDADGEYIRTLGGPGQGPGELGRFFNVGLTGESVLAVDMQDRRLTAWDLGGQYDGETPMTAGPVVFGIGGCPDGTWIGRQTQLGEERDAPRTVQVTRRSSDLEVMASLVELPTGGFQLIDAGDRSIGISLKPGPGFAAGPSCELYVLAAGEYQILALSPEGEPRWALWVPWQREVYGAAQEERFLESLRESFPDVTESDVEWPERQPAVTGVFVDGHGHLYVLPFVDGLEEGDERPVDVYSAEGERLFVGTITGRFWRAAVADHVYGVREDEVTGETLVVRYRLEEPF